MFTTYKINVDFSYFRWFSLEWKVDSLSILSKSRLYHDYYNLSKLNTLRIHKTPPSTSSSRSPMRLRRTSLMRRSSHKPSSSSSAGARPVNLVGQWLVPVFATYALKRFTKKSGSCFSGAAALGDLDQVMHSQLHQTKRIYS